MVSKAVVDGRAARVRTHIVELTPRQAAAWGDGTASPIGMAPRWRRGWKSNRLGALKADIRRTLSAATARLRSDVKADIFGVYGIGAYGIPSSIHGTGGSARESYRQFLSSTIQPLAKIVVEELAVKLDTPNLALDFTELRAADISSRARAYGVLINAGMDPAEAAEATGLE